MYASLYDFAISLEIKTNQKGNPEIRLGFAMLLNQTLS
jgi:hypothetical protein